MTERLTDADLDRIEAAIELVLPGEPVEPEEITALVAEVRRLRAVVNIQPGYTALALPDSIAAELEGRAINEKLLAEVQRDNVAAEQDLALNGHRHDWQDLGGGTSRCRSCGQFYVATDFEPPAPAPLDTGRWYADGREWWINTETERARIKRSPGGWQVEGDVTASDLEAAAAIIRSEENK